MAASEVQICNVALRKLGARRITALTDDTEEIYIMNADGSEKTNISNTTGYDYVCDWSPDGKRILFISERNSPSASLKLYSYMKKTELYTIFLN